MVTQEHFEVVENYADLKAQIKSLEAKAKEIQPEVMAVVKQADGELSVNGVKLSIATRKRYTYPAHVEAMADSLKQARNNAEIDGYATAIETEYLVCR